MQEPSDGKATVRFTDIDLADANVRKHVRDGMKLTHLGIEFNGVMSCVIDELGGLGKLKLLGVASGETQGEEDLRARFDAEFVLLTGTLRGLLRVLGKALENP
jgi:recombination associated protein RdgC